MKSRILLLLAAVALSGCPGTLDNPEDFREGGSSGGGGSCPPGTNVETDILGKATGSGCATKICHDAQDPAGNLDLASPGLASRLLDQTSTSTDCSGHVLVDGTDIAPMGERALNEVRQKFGMVFQYSALLDSMNVMENVAFPLREHTKLRDKEIRQRVKDKLAILKLEGTENRFPSQLSGGMRKRVGLARALMLEPEVLMYDEPTSGLDPISSRMVDDLILETRDRFGVTSVVISHDMAGALRIADSITLLDKGQVVAGGTPRQIVDSSHEMVRRFLDSSGIAAERLVSHS